MQLSLALCIITAALSDALAPTRRRTALQKLTVGALSLTTAQRAVAATNAEAEKVRVASRELNELLKNEDALRFKVLVEGSGTLTRRPSHRRHLHAIDATQLTMPCTQASYR